MGRDSYRFRELDQERDKRKQLDPKWRGVGLILIALFATAGYYFADWFLRANAENGWIYIPRAALYPKFVPFLGGGLLIKIIVAFLFTLLTYSILSVIYAMSFPIRHGETDVPVDRKAERRKKIRERIEQKKRKKY
ncbi:MAG: hypothetical protein MUO58_01380 [Anaerolineales bacterium]|jgi:hypothetical protein|nr:hypothetical protein [Anaerolineales bacterium]